MIILYLNYLGLSPNLRAFKKLPKVFKVKGDNNGKFKHAFMSPGTDQIFHHLFVHRTVNYVIRFPYHLY